MFNFVSKEVENSDRKLESCQRKKESIRGVRMCVCVLVFLFPSGDLFWRKLLPFQGIQTLYGQKTDFKSDRTSDVLVGMNRCYLTVRQGVVKV